MIASVKLGPKMAIGDGEVFWQLCSPRVDSTNQQTGMITRGRIRLTKAEAATPKVGYVLEGEIETHDGRAQVSGQERGFFHFRSGLPHGYCNVGITPARIIWINTPPTF